MTKAKKRRKNNSTLEEESFEKSGKSAEGTESRDRGNESDLEESGIIGNAEEIGKKIERAIEEMNDARSRCNGRISGQLKILLGEVKKGTGDLVRIASNKEEEITSMRKEIEMLRTGTETLKRNLNELGERMRDFANIGEIGKEICEMRELVKEMKEMKRACGERGSGSSRWEFSSTPITHRETGRYNRKMEEDRIEEIREEETGKMEARRGRGISYAEIARAGIEREKENAGKNAGVQIRTRAIVETRAGEERVAGDNPKPQRVRKETGIRGETGRPEQRRAEEKAVGTRVETVKIRSQKAYPELVGQMRKVMDPKNSEVNIISVRKDVTGGMSLRIRGKEEHLEKFRETLKTGMEEDSSVQRIQRMGYIHVGNMDLLTTEEEILDGLSEAVGVKKEEMKVTSLRPAYGESQKATVKLPKDAAIKLERVGRVKIGYVACRIYIRMMEERCFKCGGTGHVAAKCEDDRYIGRCFGCGEEGHFARECTKKTGKQRKPEGTERKEGNSGEKEGKGDEGEIMQVEDFEDAPDQFQQEQGSS